MVRAAQNVAWTYGLQSDDELLVYMARPQHDASITLRLPETMAGSLLDPDVGNEIQPLRIETRPWDLTTLSLPPGRAVVLVLTRVR
jgi:hypothetical protein